MIIIMIFNDIQSVSNFILCFSLKYQDIEAFINTDPIANDTYFI